MSPLINAMHCITFDTIWVLTFDEKGTSYTAEIFALYVVVFVLLWKQCVLINMILNTFLFFYKNESLYQSILLSLINEERSNRILIKMEPKELIIDHFFVSARPHVVNKWWQFQTSLLLNCETIVFTASQYGFAIFAPVPRHR